MLRVSTSPSAISFSLISSRNHAAVFGSFSLYQALACISDHCTPRLGAVRLSVKLPIVSIRG